MRVVNLVNCDSDHPLSVQLEEQLSDMGFKWRKHQHSPLVDAITECFRTRYDFMDDVDCHGLNVRCGFCAHPNITHYYVFRRRTRLAPCLSQFGEETVRVVMPDMLTTGSECKEFPRVLSKIREFYRDQKVFFENGGSSKTDKAIASSVVPNSNNGVCYFPSCWYVYDDKFIDMLNKDYAFFVFVDRKLLPSGCDYMYELHQKVKAFAPRWHWRPGKSHIGQYVGNYIYGINNDIADGCNFIVGVPSFVIQKYQKGE